MIPNRVRWGLGALLLLVGCGSSSLGGGGDAGSNLVAPGTPIGSCLVEYNGAFVSAGASACCARLGGPNTCDVSVQCNATSGSPCCLFYSTSSTVLGQMCCRYSNGDPLIDRDGNDATAVCDALISYGR